MTVDLAVFENSIIEESNETKSTPIPEGAYDATVDGIRLNKVKINKGERAGQEVPVLEVTWQIHGEDDLAKELNREKILVRQSIWLDISGNALAFGPNQNLGLGRLREAVGLNQPGKPFQFKMLEGRGPCKIHVGFTPENAQGDKFNQVNKVEPIE